MLFREERSGDAGGPSSCDRVRVPRPDRRNGHADDATRAHNTLSPETTHIRVLYPFHPLCGASLQVIRRPKRGNGAASVLDPTGRRLKIPLWMLSLDSAQMHISDQAHLSRESLLSLTSLLAPLMDSTGRTRDNLLQAVPDECKGGHRAATTTSEPDPDGRVARTHRPNDSSRTGRSHGPHSGGGFSNRRGKPQ